MYDSIAVFDAQKVNVKTLMMSKWTILRYDLIISASDPKSSHLIVERIFEVIQTSPYGGFNIGRSNAT